MTEQFKDNIEIREAVKSDLEGISEVFYESAKLHYKNDPLTFKDPKDFTSYTKKVSDFFKDRDINSFIAISGNEITGVLRYEKVQRKETGEYRGAKSIKVKDVAVKEKYRRSGIGSALMKRVLDLAQSLEYIDFVNLRVRAFNKEAVSFYEKLGFSVDSYKMSRKVNHGK